MFFFPCIINKKRFLFLNQRLFQCWKLFKFFMQNEQRRSLFPQALNACAPKAMVTTGVVWLMLSGQTETLLVLHFPKKITNLEEVKSAHFSSLHWGVVARWVERMTLSKEVLDPIPAVAAHSLLVGSVSVLVQCDRLKQKSWSPCSVSCVAGRKIVRRQSWDPSAILPSC